MISGANIKMISVSVQKTAELKNYYGGLNELVWIPLSDKLFYLFIKNK